ncbi:MAG: magnesium transporter [Myxococcota bacterium]
MDEASQRDDLVEVWAGLSAEERVEAFLRLPPEDAEPFFLERMPLAHAQILLGLPANQRRLWMRLLAPDDAVDALQHMPPERRQEYIELLDDATRHEVQALLAFNEDDAGGLMSTAFARARPDVAADEALRYLRRQAQAKVETIYYAYVLDDKQHLLGVLSFRELFSAPPDKLVRDIMRTDFEFVRADTDQEEVAQLFARTSLLAIPVVGEDQVMQGIVTVDDIVHVVQDSATEDVQKLGGSEALDMPYLQIGFWRLVMKRAGWLAILFIGELFTTSAMGAYKDEMEKAIVLAMFVPLIISSGGNSGSQASTLIIRAMALGEVRLRNWFRVMRRELLVGLALGAILALLGLTRILIWQAAFDTYGVQYLGIALSVAMSLVAIVMWGTLAGSMLPFMLRRLGLDPASASAPFVATLVDVSGLVIYFTVAELVLGGTPLLPGH